MSDVQEKSRVWLGFDWTQHVRLNRHPYDSERKDGDALSLFYQSATDDPPQVMHLAPPWADAEDDDESQTVANVSIEVLGRKLELTWVRRKFKLPAANPPGEHWGWLVIVQGELNVSEDSDCIVGANTDGTPEGYACCLAWNSQCASGGPLNYRTCSQWGLELERAWDYEIEMRKQQEAAQAKSSDSETSGDEEE